MHSVERRPSWTSVSDTVETAIPLHSQGSASVALILLSVVCNHQRRYPCGHRTAPAAPCPRFIHFSLFVWQPPTRPPWLRPQTSPCRHFACGISVAVFANLVARKNGNGKYPVHNISLQRTYRDGDDYKTTSVFRRDDLPILQRLLQQAWDYIVEVESDQAPEEEPE